MQRLMWFAAALVLTFGAASLHAQVPVPDPNNGPIPDPVTGIPLPVTAPEYAERFAQQASAHSDTPTANERMAANLASFDTSPAHPDQHPVSAVYYPASSFDKNLKPRTDRTDAPRIFILHSRYDKTKFTLSLDRGELNSVIHYTLDGSLPTVDSPVYTDFVKVAKGTRVRAIAFSGTRKPSKISQTKVKG